MEWAAVLWHVVTGGHSGANEASVLLQDGSIFSYWDDPIPDQMRIAWPHELQHSIF